MISPRKQEFSGYTGDIVPTEVNRERLSLRLSHRMWSSNSYPNPGRY